MSNFKTQLGGGEDHLKLKGEIFNCLDDILMANETTIVLPGRDLEHHQTIHPIVIVEPKIEIKVELSGSSPGDRMMERDLLQVPEGKKNKSKSNGSVSPHSNCSNESATRRHHHRHHQKQLRGSANSETNKENVPETTGTGEGVVGEDQQEGGHHHRHHHRSGNTTSHHHHHHHHHHHSNTTDHHSHNHHHSSTTAGTVAGDEAGGVAKRPDQVLRKYIIKKITIRKQDGSTKKIVIKKPVDEPNGPVRLSKVDNKCTREWW